MQNKEEIHKELPRKLVHVLFYAGLIFFVLAFDPKVVKWSYVVFSVIFILLDLYRLSFGKILNRLTEMIFGKVIRPWEYKRLSSVSFTVLANLITLLFFPKWIFILCAVFAGLGDTSSMALRLLGQKIKSSKLKVFLRILFFALVSIVGGVAAFYFMPEIFPEIIIFLIIFGSLIAAIIEYLTHSIVLKFNQKKFIYFLDDNYTIVLGAAVVLWVVEKILNFS